MIGLWLSLACLRPAPVVAPPTYEDSPGSPQSWAAWAQARALVEQGDLAQAEAAYRRALFFDPHDPLILSALGELQLAQGQPEAALSTLREAQTWGAQGLAQRLEIEALRALGQDSLAQKTLLAWNERSDLSPEQRLERGLALNTAGEQSWAFADLDAAIGAGVYTPQALSAFTTLALAQGSGAAALQRLRGLGESGLAGLRARALLALELGDPAEAQDLLPALMALAPEDPLTAELGAWLTQAPAAIALASALSRSQRSCVLQRDADLLRADAAQALAACGASDLDLAAWMFSTGQQAPLERLAASSAGRDGELIQAMLALSQGATEAEASLQALSASMTAPPLTHALYGELLAKQGRCPEALPQLHLATSSLPHRLPSWLAQGRCAAAQQDTALAEASFARAARLPYGEDALTALLSTRKP